MKKFHKEKEEQNNFNQIHFNNLKIMKNKYQNEKEKEFISYNNNKNNNINMNINSNKKYLNDIIKDNICYSKYNICGIINYGKNDFLNTSLQILSSCEIFVNILNKYSNYKSELLKLLKEAINIILTQEKYDPRYFLDYYHKISQDFENPSCCQNFIRTLLKNLNNQIYNQNSDYFACYIKYRPKNESKEYQVFNEFLKSNNLERESQLLSIFSGVTKFHSFGKCHICNYQIDEFSFSYFLDQLLYLDFIKFKCSFAKVLDENYGKSNNLVLNCPYCKQETTIKEEAKIIKLPEILMFTLERNQGSTNNVEIMPNEIIDMSRYVDESLKFTNTSTIFELFAISIIFGTTQNNRHELCQVKRNGQWYEINDTMVKKINSTSYFDRSYGLFYKKKN